MRIINTLFLAGLCGLLLASCSSNEEVIEVEKPQYNGATSIDLTTGQVYDSNGNPSDYTQLTRGVSSSNVEIYSLDDPIGGSADGVSTRRDHGYRAPARGLIGNSNVEISPIGQPDIGSVRAAPASQVRQPSQVSSSMMPPLNRYAPATTMHPQGVTGDFVNITPQGEEMTRIYFDHGSIDLDTDDLNAIATVAQLYNANRGNIISVEGYASERSEIGDPVRRKEINLKVSLDRAYAVARALIYNGIPASAIRTVAWGEERGGAASGAADAESMARRVDILSVAR